MYKKDIIKNIQSEMKLIDEKIKIRTERIGNLVDDLPFNLLFGNKETARKHTQFIFNHQEAIEDLKRKKIVLLENLKKVA